MSDAEKLAAFKQEAVRENEEKYGEELRERYGDEEIASANQKFLEMTEQDFGRFKRLEMEIKLRLEQGVLRGMKPQDKEAEEIMKLHREWLTMAWKSYAPEKHRGVACLYTADERFTRYYDEKVPGCAELLREIVLYWVK